MRTKFDPDEKGFVEELLPYPLEEHFGRVICGEPIACAYEWIVAYAASLVPEDELQDPQDPDLYDEYRHEPITARELIECALNNDGWNYISRGGVLEGESPDPLLFEKLSLIKGEEVEYHHFFSCAC